MRHLDQDVLALMALGEPVHDDAGRGHLESCADCRNELASLKSVVATARSVTPADEVVPPPPHVWDGIRDELGLSPRLEPDGETVTTPVSPAPGERRGRVAPWVAAAAAAGVLIGGAAGSWWADQRSQAGAVVAEAELEPLPGWDAAGVAVVEELDEGTRELVITVQTGQDARGYREVWLIDREVSQLVSLGVLEGDTGRFTVPDGLDLGEFPVVDVSDEPFDGDPNHSGDSIVRGLLDV